MKFLPKSDQEIILGNLIKPGVYDFEVMTAQEKTSRNGNEMIEVKLKVWDEEGKERIVYDYILEVFPKKLKHFAYTIGLGRNYEDGNLEADDCLNLCGELQIGIQAGQPNPQGGYYSDRNIVLDYINNNVNDNKKVSNGEKFDDDIPF